MELVPPMERTVYVSCPTREAREVDTAASQGLELDSAVNYKSIVVSERHRTLCASHCLRLRTRTYRPPAPSLCYKLIDICHRAH